MHLQYVHSFMQVEGNISNNFLEHVRHGQKRVKQKEVQNSDLLTGNRRLSEVVRFGMACRERCPLSRGGVCLPAGDRKVTCRIPVCLAWLGGRRRSPLVHLSLSISRSLHHHREKNIRFHESPCRGFS